MPQRFFQALALHKGMGSEAPHLTNTVGIENCVRRRKPVIGRPLRRQGAHSSEMQVGRPAVTEEMIAKNGYGVVERTITIFC